MIMNTDQTPSRPPALSPTEEEPAPRRPRLLEMADADEKNDGAEQDDFDEEDFDDEFDDDFEEELDDEYDLLDAEVTEEDLADDDDADIKIGGDFVDEDDEDAPPKGEPSEEE